MAELLQLKYDLKDLSDEEHYALNYCLALLEPEKFAQPFLVVDQAFRKASGDTKANWAKARGLEWLLEKGIIEANRDGHRDWKVIRVHLERLERSVILKPKLVTEDGV